MSSSSAVSTVFPPFLLVLVCDHSCSCGSSSDSSCGGHRSAGSRAKSLHGSLLPAICMQLQQGTDCCLCTALCWFVSCSIACTLQLVTFFFIAIFALHPHDYHNTEEYPHFFKMPVLMLILITVLNDGTLISVAYDHVNPARHPEKWNLKV